MPIHLSGAYEELEIPAGSLPECERLAQAICSLPVFPGMSDEEILRVAAAVGSFAPATTRRAA